MSIIQLRSGGYLDLKNITPDSIFIEDIAHALSHICRFTGHTRKFYSVAQHSVLVSNLVIEPELRKAALLHDAAEAYIGDVSTPLKRLLPDYRRIEFQLEEAIAEKFSISNENYSKIKEADLIALVTEQRYLMERGPSDQIFWPELFEITPLDVEIVPLSSYDAREQFMFRFQQLTMQDKLREARRNRQTA